MTILIGAIPAAAKAAPKAKEPTKAEIIASLAELGIDAGKGLSKPELEAMLAEAEAAKE